MTNREAMRALIEKAYAARAEGNVKALVAAFHSNGVFELAGNRDALTIAGAVEGHAGLEQAMTNYIAAFEFRKREILSFVAEGDRAAVHSRLTVRFVPKDKTFTTDVLDLFTFKDGKIGELVEFADTALIKEIAAT
jgi:ketosteroid isomerase-like protein